MGGKGARLAKVPGSGMEQDSWCNLESLANAAARDLPVHRIRHDHDRYLAPDLLGELLGSHQQAERLRLLAREDRVAPMLLLCVGSGSTRTVEVVKMSARSAHIPVQGADSRPCPQVTFRSERCGQASLRATLRLRWTGFK